VINKKWRIKMTPNEKEPPRHAPPKGATTQDQELLYDPNVPTASHAEQARTLASKMGTATLCTMSVEPQGYPYGSFVTYALYEGNPIFLISSLAEHTKNLNNDSKASLLIAETGEGNPLALGRVTLIGECKKLQDSKREAVKKIFIEKHQDAKFYVDFKDFFFYKLMVSEVRYIGGFGRMSWVNDKQWFEAEPDPLAPYSLDIIEHMNEDHVDTMVLYCKTMSKAKDTSGASMTGIDRYGFEMSAKTSNGPRPIRLGFENEVKDAEEARKELVRMAKKARKMTK
tara:strand:+ start:239 stop:1090 length:852 start_codon:yes stop_codon:yes gene_type:complete